MWLNYSSEANQSGPLQAYQMLIDKGLTRGDE